MSATRALEAFAAHVAPDRCDAAIELDRAALLIAAHEYPKLDVEHYLKRLDALAARVRQRLKSDAGRHEAIRQLRQVLAADEGFRGNTDDYEDPSNSYLNDVLERRTGIPISLSVVYIEVARRVGIGLQGVGFPGHFLVREGEILLDPFDGGRVVTEAELRERLERSTNGTVAFEPELLATVDKRRILFRMLANLKSIHVEARDPERALAAVDRMLALRPDAAREHRDRGLFLARLERPVEALGAIRRYRELAPNAGDGEEIDGIVANLRMQIGFSN